MGGILTPPFTSWATSNKLLNLPGLHRPHMKNGKDYTCPMGLPQESSDQVSVRHVVLLGTEEAPMVAAEAVGILSRER